MEKVTVETVGELVDAHVMEPTLVRNPVDGSLDVIPGIYAGLRPVVATREDYMTFCDGQDDEFQRKAFADDVNTYGK